MKNTERDEKPRPILPEREAVALTSALRKKHLAGVVFSVFAFINAKGVRGLTVCCDMPDGTRYDMNLRADTDVDKLADHAANRILSRIANV